MVRFGVSTVADTMKLDEEAPGKVSDTLQAIQAAVREGLLFLLAHQQEKVHDIKFTILVNCSLFKICQIPGI